MRLQKKIQVHVSEISRLSYLDAETIDDKLIVKYDRECLAEI